MQFPLKILRDREFDVFGFGTNAVDFLITVPQFPAFASKVELDHYVRAAGGEIASTMVGLQRLGVKTAYAGSFGNDDAGLFGIQTLSAEGVDLTFSRKIEGAETQIAFILIDETTGERTVIWKRDARLAFDAPMAPTAAMPRCSVVHMTPHDTAACVRLAAAARENGTLVSLDIDNMFDGVEELLPLIDVLISSSEFPRKLLGISDPKEALAAMQDKYGSALAGITLGDQGSIMRCAGEYFETTGFDVPGGCKDTTGAGDAFRVGLLFGLLNDEPIENAGRTANAVAALKCREIGARTALPKASELESFLEKS
ncbi:MAG: carbohydrate kinase family protein [Pyrinomonadaceae bacterium]